jgi:formylglycine-generating enzyme required for sulfatase activity
MRSTLTTGRIACLLISGTSFWLSCERELARGESTAAMLPSLNDGVANITKANPSQETEGLTRTQLRRLLTLVLRDLDFSDFDSAASFQATARLRQIPSGQFPIALDLVAEMPGGYTVALITSTLNAQVPQMISYQGRVAVGDPQVNFDGTGEFRFALVNGGANLNEQATGTSVRTGGFITSVTLTNGGSGYASAPAVSFSGGGGAGAEAITTISGDTVTSIVVTNAGSGYTSAPIATITSPPDTLTFASYWSNDGTSTDGSEPTGAVSLPVTKGLYSVLLGANMTPIPNTVFANADVHLRVWFDDGTNGSQLLTPDQRIAAVGYAMVASSLQPGVDIIAGTVTAASFIGDGSGLTNIPASAIVQADPPSSPAGMVLIPAGAFIMGDSVGDTDITNAAPVSTTVSAFYMDATEVTRLKWDDVKVWATLYTDLPAGAGKGADHPVQTVNWYDCVKWCNARSEQAGKTPVYYTDDAHTTVYRTGDVDVTNVQVDWTANGYRLPTEAEWEKAARGGLSGQRFPWGNTISQNLANYKGNTTSYTYDKGPDGYNAIGSDGGTSPATSPVSSFAANGYGLYDMAGNVFEWCWDRYGTPYAGGTDPHGATTGAGRVLRGGSWNYYANNPRCDNRVSYGPVDANYHYGFRAVLALAACRT